MVANAPLNMVIGYYGVMEFPFINLMLTAGLSSNVADASGNILVDANGYPLPGALSTTITGVVAIPPEFTDSGTRWVLDWQGNMGSLANPAFQIVSGGYTVVSGGGFVSGGTSSDMSVYSTGGTGGSVEFTMNAPHSNGTLTFKFISGASFDGTLTRLRLYRKTQQSELATSDFDATFKSYIRELRPRSLRFINWTNANLTNLTKAEYLRPSGAMTYDYYYCPSIWAGNASGTDAYSISLAGASVSHGQTIQLQFVNANGTTPATLSLNGGSSYPIIDMYGVAMTNARSPAITANSIWTLLYNSVLQSWIAQSGGIRQGVPIEKCIALCNEVGCDFWYNVPFHTTDSLFLSQAATCRDTMTGSTIYELANEVWNPSFGFPNSALAAALGAAYNFPSGNNERYHGPYSLRICQLFSQLPSVYGANQKYKRVLAFQAVGNYDQIKKWRCEGFDLNPSLGYSGYNSLVNVDYSAEGNQPKDFIDYYSYAPYLFGAQLRGADSAYATPMDSGGPVGGSAGLMGAADDYATGTSANKAKALAWVDWDLRQGTRGGVDGPCTLLSFSSTRNLGTTGAIGLYPTWDALATAHGKQVALYEMAFEPLPLTTSRCTALGIDTKYGDTVNGSGQVTAKGTVRLLLEAYKTSNLFQQLVFDQQEQFSGNSRSALTCWFLFRGGTILNGSYLTDQWSLGPAPDGSMFKSYDALALRANNKRRIALTT